MLFVTHSDYSFLTLTFSIYTTSDYDPFSERADFFCRIKTSGPIWSIPAVVGFNCKLQDIINFFINPVI